MYMYMNKRRIETKEYKQRFLYYSALIAKFINC